MPSASTTNPARLALGVAALVAVAAVGVAVVRGRQDAAPPANSRMADTPAGKVGDMIGQLEAKMRGNTTDADGWRMLGWAYFETGRYGESATAYRKAATIDPAKAEYWSALGEATVLAEKGGVSPAAEAAFRRALAVDPKDPRARYFIGVRKDMTGNHAAAVDDWIALLKDTPPGAPWEADVRQLIGKVAAANKIDIAGRMPAAHAAMPGGTAMPGAAAMPGATPGPAAAGAVAPGSAADVATAGIPGPTRDQMQAAAGLPPSQQNVMIQGMVNGLAARLAANPRDTDGWIRLMRARMVLDDAPAARQALDRARAANPAARAKLEEAARALGVPGA